MTTDEATRTLGQMLADGEYGGDTATERALARAVWAGRDWQWSVAADALHTAYRRLGAAAPATTELPGYMWHCGTHPVQIASYAAERANKARDEALRRYHARGGSYAE